MVPPLHHPAVLQHQDGVGVADGGEPVGDDEDRPAPHEAVQPLLDELLRPGIDRGGGLVQDQHRGLGHRRPGDGQQLPLALGEVCPVGGQHGLIALGQVGDEVVGVGDLGCPDAVLVRGRQPPVADVPSPCR